jgi:hypothetical protein
MEVYKIGKKAKRIVKAWNVLWSSNGALESERKNLSGEKGNKREMTKSSNQL